MLLIVIVVCLVKVIKSESDTVYEISVQDDKFEGTLPSGFKIDGSNWYYGKLNDVTGCSADLEIVPTPNEENAKEADFATYINWSNTENNSFPCSLKSLLSNIALSRIKFFILILPSRNKAVAETIAKELENESNANFITYHGSNDKINKLMSLTSVKGELVGIEVTKKSDSNENPSIPMSSMAILFVTVAFVTLMTVSIGWLVFYYAQRCRQRNMRERLQSRLCIAAKRAVAKLPTKVVPDYPKNSKKSKKTSPPPDNDSVCSSCSSDDADFCPVCLDLYKPREIIRILPCKHEFHKSCVDPWLFDHRSCPMCKLDILEYFGMLRGERTGSGRQNATANDTSPQSGDNGGGGTGNDNTSNNNNNNNNNTVRVDQEVQTDFINSSPTSQPLQDEITPAPFYHHPV